MLFDRTYDEAMKVAERIRVKIEEAAIPFDNPPELRGTMTFGVAEYDYGRSMEEGVMKADKALYAGKENGRNRVEGYGDCHKD